MKHLINKYDKKLIADLPRALFPGRIYILQSETEANRAVDFLMSQPILGFDTETRPNFKKGPMRKVALLQVSTPDVCFLFRLNIMGTLPKSVCRLLEDRTITKVGLSLHDDLRALQQRSKFTPGTFVELQQEVKKLGIEDMSLQKLYANLFGEKIAKNQQLTNWEADALTEAQQGYAATDAWACIMIYKEIQQLLKNKEYTLEKVPEII